MDFMKMRVYLDDHELNGFHREDYFLAQIAYIFACANSKTPGKLQDYLIKFTKEKPEDTSVQAREQRALQMSRMIAGMFGFNLPAEGESNGG